MLSMIESSEQLVSNIRAEFERFRVPAMRDFARQYLIAPKLHYRQWDYSLEPLSYPCWLIADFGESDVGLAYSECGHGTNNPWGVVLIHDEWFGRDDSWFLTLEDAVINSGRWYGERPENYEIS
jgi:hypothetical protein